MATDLLMDYKTSHIPLAAFLAIRGCQVTKIVAEQSRGVFLFMCVPRNYIFEFNDGKATVEPGDFALKMSQLTQTAKRVMAEGAT